MFISPAVDEPGRSHFLWEPSSTHFMNACKNPTMVTLVAISPALSMIGMVTIELLVETRFPDCGPLWEVSFIGAVGHGVGSSVSCPWPEPAALAWVRHSAAVALSPAPPRGLIPLSH